jgi:hypothetical protein
VNMREFIIVFIAMVLLYALGRLIVPEEPYYPIQQELIKMEEE